MTTPGEKLQELQPQTHKMQKSQLYFNPLKTLFFLLLFSHAQMRFCSGVSVLDLKSVKDSNFNLMGKRGCSEKLQECSEMVDEEDMMDSESNRRVLLMQKKYISYGTLKRDLVPCNTPGASYYNCKAPGAANNYNRGCEIITRCAREEFIHALRRHSFFLEQFVFICVKMYQKCEKVEIYNALAEKMLDKGPLLIQPTPHTGARHTGPEWPGGLGLSWPGPLATLILVFL